MLRYNLVYSEINLESIYGELDTCLLHMISLVLGWMDAWKFGLNMWKPSVGKRIHFRVGDSLSLGLETQKVV